MRRWIHALQYQYKDMEEAGLVSRLMSAKSQQGTFLRKLGASHIPRGNPASGSDHDITVPTHPYPVHPVSAPSARYCRWNQCHQRTGYRQHVTLPWPETKPNIQLRPRWWAHGELRNFPMLYDSVYPASIVWGSIYLSKDVRPKSIICQIRNITAAPNVSCYGSNCTQCWHDAMKHKCCHDTSVAIHVVLTCKCFKLIRVIDNCIV